METDFSFHNPTKILFGKNAEQHIGEELSRDGATKVLIHYGSQRVKKNGLIDTIVAELDKQNIASIGLGGVVANPHLDIVEEGIETCREEKIDYILAVGGGSVIDSAKAIAMGVPYSGSTWDFFEGKTTPQSALPVSTVLTIPAAGSESSIATVISHKGRKLGFIHPLLQPRISFLNPEHTLTLPDYQTACGISDMLAHVMERYFVTLENVEVTDRLCEAHMKSIISLGKQVVADPQNYELRAELMLAGTIAHNDSLNIGRTKGEWSSHAIEHELSAKYDIAHGAGLAIIFPAWIKHVYSAHPQKFEQWAQEVWGLSGSGDAVITEAITALETFYKDIGMPTRLTEANITDDASEEMAELLIKQRGGALGSFKSLEKEDLVSIYKAAQ